MAKVGIDLKDISQIIPKKQKISSRNKGKSGEYFFANFLTELTGKKFMKVPNSGAILGASNQQKVLQLTAGVANVFLGDLIPPADFKHKHILECKNYAKFAFDKLKKQKTNGQLEEWLGQLLHDCITYLMMADSRPMLPFLFIKITGVGSWVVYNVDFTKKILPGVSLEKEFEIIYSPRQELLALGMGTLFHMTDFKTWTTKNKDLLFQ